MIRAFLFFICLGSLVFGKPTVDIWDKDIGLQDCLYKRENFVWSIREENSHVAVLSDQYIKNVQKMRKMSYADEGYEKIVACLIKSRDEYPSLYDYVTLHNEEYDLILTCDEDLLNQCPDKCKFFYTAALQNGSFEALNLLDVIWPYLSSFFIPNSTCDLNPFLRPITEASKPSGLNGIDYIYLINLKERPLKLARMEQLFSENGLIVNHFYAINGWKLEPNEQGREVTKFGNTYKNAPNRWVSWGGIGCYLSHLSIIKNAYEKNFNSIWIMEDDLIFHVKPEVVCEMLKKVNEIDPEWDIFYTDSNNRDATGRFRIGSHPIIPPIHLDNKGRAYCNNVEVINDDFAKIRARGGTYSMILSKRGIKKIYETLSKLPILTPYDDVLPFLDDVRYYISRKPVVTHLFDEVDSLPSDTWSPPNPLQ